jgi:hypothetical protein
MIWGVNEAAFFVFVDFTGVGVNCSTGAGIVAADFGFAGLDFLDGQMPVGSGGTIGGTGQSGGKITGSLAAGSRSLTTAY